MANGTNDADSTVYRDSLAAALAAALAVGLILALIDIMVTSGRGPSGAELLTLTLGLYALPSLCLGLFVGAVVGAWRATFGAGALGRVGRKLGSDRQLDIEVTAGLIASAVMALVFVGVCSVLAVGLVGNVERKGTGALLLGVMLLATLSVLALAGLPVYRAARKLAHLVPRLGPLPAAVSLCVLAVVVKIAVGAFIVFTRLEWRALHLGTYLLLLGFPALMLVWALLWYKLAAGLREKVPRRGTLVVVATAIAVALPLLTLRGAPDPATMAAIGDNSVAARFFVERARALTDGDGDGFSDFLGGPDCDDSNPHVHPEAKEIPDNGLDDNCMGGDRKSADTAPARKPGPPVAANGNGNGNGSDKPKPADDPCAKDGNAGESRPAAAKNLLFIMIDTLRADRLGVAGYQRAGKSLSPRMDELAKGSGYFTRAYAQAPNTPRSLPSIFASRFPSQIAVHKKFHNFPKVLDDNLLLFEVLQQAGLYTAGYASHFYFEERRNIHQGFDLFDNDGALDIKGSNKDIAAPRIVPKVAAKLAELGASKQRFGLFVHLFEPHSTYVKHEQFPITERGTAGLMQKYDYEIAFVDIWVGKLLDALRESGLDEDTMVVLLSDHGEAFGVHRVAGKKMFFHGQTLYDELLRVPLMIRVPGVEAGQYDDVVNLTDVAPTVVEALGVDRPESFLGHSLLGRMRGEVLTPHFGYGELLPAPSWNHSARMLVAADGRFKLYARTSDRRFELYDVRADPEERSELSGTEKEQLARMQEDLVRFVEVDLQ